MLVNTKKIKIILLIIINFLFLSLSLAPSYADEEEPLIHNIEAQSSAFAEASHLKTSDKGLEESIIDIINVILGFLGLLLLIIIIYSGFQWMTSGGNEEKISEARKRLVSAVIGLGIVLGAWIIANAIMFIVQGENEGKWLNLF